MIVATDFFENIFNVTGGAKYHWSAFKNLSRWQAFKDDLNVWMQNWKPQAEGLVIVGPSAGYLLKDELLVLYLNRFKKIEAWDIDPLSRYFFKFRHPTIANHMDWINGDWFQQKLISQSSLKNQAYLFTGVLGQLTHVMNDRDHQLYFEALKRLTQDVPFLSFHDRLLSQAPFDSLSPLTSDHHLQSNDLVKHFWGNPVNHTHKLNGSLKIEEYDVGELHLNAKSFFYGAWPLRQNQNHVIEGFFN